MEHKELQERLENLRGSYPSENVDNVYLSAVGFYGSVQKRWPSRQFARVLNGEGGRLGLIHNYVVYGLAHAPDHFDGFVQYNNFVRRQYYLGDKYKWGHMSSLDEAMWEDDPGSSLYERLSVRDIDIPSLGDDPLVLEGDRPSGSLQALLPPVSLNKIGGTMRPLSDLELEFLDTLAYVGSPAEASVLVGRDPRWGYGVVRKVRRLATTVGVTLT